MPAAVNATGGTRNARHRHLEVKGELEVEGETTLVGPVAAPGGITGDLEGTASASADGAEALAATAAATAVNTAGAIVKRGASGEIAAGAVTCATVGVAGDQVVNGGTLTGGTPASVAWARCGNMYFGIGSGAPTSVDLPVGSQYQNSATGARYIKWGAVASQWSLIIGENATNPGLGGLTISTNPLILGAPASAYADDAAAAAGGVPVGGIYWTAAGIVHRRMS